MKLLRINNMCGILALLTLHAEGCEDDPSKGARAGTSGTETEGSSGVESSAEASTSDSEAEDTTGEETETTGPQPVSFGGFFHASIYGQATTGQADFYTVDYQKGVMPWWVELSLGGPVLADGVAIAGESESPAAVETALDIGGPLVATSGDVELVFEYDDAYGAWFSDYADLVAPYTGGSWTFEFPGEGAFPEATFEDVLELPAADEAAPWLETIDGLPRVLQWSEHPDAQASTLAVVAFGGVPELLCSAVLVDDGEFEVPDGCLGLGPIQLDPDVVDTVIFAFEQEFHAEVEYGGFRIRLIAGLKTDLSVPYPFVGPE